jgi:hypothetical protein
MYKQNSDLKAGDKFLSPRKEEGLVTAQCDFGKCVHGDDRPDSIHVRGVYDTIFGPTRSEFFIALPTSIPEIDTTEVI